MLAELTIQRIALIESLKLSLGHGLNAFTGETGAGKSIVLDSIGLLIGNRASTEMIRRGYDEAIVEGLFLLQSSSQLRVNELFVTWGLDTPEDGQCVVTRELFRSGRTVCRVNGRMVTVQMLRELGERLIQQHGQHDQQGLLRPEEQLRLLDLYGKHAELLQEVRGHFKTWSGLQKEWEEARLDEQERIRRLDMLSFQIDEIRAAKLRSGEEEQLREQRQKLQYTDRITSALDNAMRAVDGMDRQRGAYDLLVQASQEVASAVAYDSGLKEAAQLLESAQIYAEEASRMLAQQRSTLESNPELLDEIEERFILIRGLERKYGPTIEDILQYLRTAEQEQSALERHEEYRTELTTQLQSARDRLLKSAEILHKARVLSAKQLSIAVEEVLRQLNMPSAQVHIEIGIRGTSQNPTLSSNGMDTVMFLFTANRGETPKPLQKIASGGELSRTLLALKSVLAEVDDLDTLIFDEIDSGVSGVAAERIGEQLRILGQAHQVLCVTHSPQIAAAAQLHYSIEKHEREHDTTTDVELLNESARVRELARLLGSSMADETAEHHARALLHSYLEGENGTN